MRWKLFRHFQYVLYTCISVYTCNFEGHERLCLSNKHIHSITEHIFFSFSQSMGMLYAKLKGEMLTKVKKTHQHFLFSTTCDIFNIKKLQHLTEKKTLPGAP